MLTGTPTTTASTCSSAAIRATSATSRARPWLGSTWRALARKPVGSLTDTPMRLSPRSSPSSRPDGSAIDGLRLTQVDHDLHAQRAAGPRRRDGDAWLGRPREGAADVAARLVRVAPANAVLDRGAVDRRDRERLDRHVEHQRAIVHFRDRRRADLELD